MEICKLQQCTGCFACKAICPKNAIKVATDQYGSTFPQIDTEKCVKCNLCKKVCPNQIEKKFTYPETCFAAWSLNKADRESCASGGIATGLGRYIIEQGGVVFGASFLKEKELELVFSKAENMEELEKFKTSKYVQADTSNVYEKVKQELLQDRQVLFIGTPCQVAGVQGYLQKPYEKLLTVDIICHGVNPMQYLRQHAKTVCKTKQVSYPTFRGAKDYAMRFFNKKHELIYEKDAYEDYYFRAFLCSMMCRENCYVCPYARTERISDLTIGDFWGLDKQTLKESYNGKVSVILQNTEKGENLLSVCAEVLYMEERTVEEALKENEQLRKTASKYKDREIFLTHYPQLGFDGAMKKTCLKREIMQLKYKKTKWNIKRCLKRIIGRQDR